MSIDMLCAFRKVIGSGQASEGEGTYPFVCACTHPHSFCCLFICVCAHACLRLHRPALIYAHVLVRTHPRSCPCACLHALGLPLHACIPRTHTLGPCPHPRLSCPRAFICVHACSTHAHTRTGPLSTPSFALADTLVCLAHTPSFVFTLVPRTHWALVHALVCARQHPRLSRPRAFIHVHTCSRPHSRSFVHSSALIYHLHLHPRLHVYMVACCPRLQPRLQPFVPFFVPLFTFACCPCSFWCLPSN
jgi:hypothetical protein